MNFNDICKRVYYVILESKKDPFNKHTITYDYIANKACIQKSLVSGCLKFLVDNHYIERYNNKSVATSKVTTNSYKIIKLWR